MATKDPRAYLANEPMDNFNPPINNAENEEGCFEICININRMKFISHYLMSEEHIMQVDLIKKYENYVNQGTSFFTFLRKRNEKHKKKDAALKEAEFHKLSNEPKNNTKYRLTC